MPVPELELRERLASYVAADNAEADDALAQLEDWLTGAAADADGSEPADRLAFDSLRLISEFHNGDWSDSEIRERLGALGRTYWFQQAPKNVIGGSVAGLIQEDQQAGAAGRSRAKASA